MNTKLIVLLSAISLMAVSSVAQAQCLQNGVPCGQIPAVTGSAVPNSGTLVMGTDGANSYPILTDNIGRPITSIYSLPALPTGTNTIGSIANTAFGISGTLPAFSSTPTFNLGTLNGAATDATLTTIKTTLGNPFQAGGSIGNTSFGATQSGTWTVGLNGSLPAFASTPTVNIGTAPTLTTSVQGNVTTNAPTYTNGTAQPLSLSTSGALRVDAGSVSLAAGTSVIGNFLRAQVYPETTAVLAASATFTAPSHDSGPVMAGTPYGSFTCFVNTDRAGTMILSGSNDNTTFYTIVNQTFSASVPTTTTSRVLFRYHRCAVTNTATSAQTTMVLNSQFGQ